VVNGSETTVSASDRGLAYGDGLFETMASIEGRIRYLDYHLDRLAAGCRRLSISLPSLSALREEIEAACPQRGNAVLKLIVTRGSSARGYRPPADASPTKIMSVSDWPNHPRSHYTRGITVRSLRTPIGENPVLAGMKHLCKLEQVMAQMELRETDADEGLQYTNGGVVVGGTMSNLFVLIDGVLSTPSVASCGVSGVMRRVVMETAEKLRLPLREQRIERRDLAKASELFLTNAIIGIWPITRLDGMEFPIGETAKRLMSSLGVSGRE